MFGNDLLHGFFYQGWNIELRSDSEDWHAQIRRPHISTPEPYRCSDPDRAALVQEVKRYIDSAIAREPKTGETPTGVEAETETREALGSP